VFGKKYTSTGVPHGIIKTQEVAEEYCCCYNIFNPPISVFGQLTSLEYLAGPDTILVMVTDISVNSNNILSGSSYL
jgi:hypothetical protein